MQNEVNNSPAQSIFRVSASEKAFQLFMSIPERGKSEISPRQMQKSYVSHHHSKEYIPPKDTFFPGPGSYELKTYIDRFKKNDSLENLRKNNKMVMSQDPLAKRKSIPNQPMTVLLELTPKEPDMEDSFSSKMLETDNHFKREVIPKRTDDAVRIFNSNTYKTLKPISKNLNLKVEVRPESRSRKQQSPIKIDILSKDLFNQSNIHTRAPSRASSQEFSPSMEKKFERFTAKNKTTSSQYGSFATPQRKRKKEIDKSLAVLSSEMLGKLSQRFNANQARPKNIVLKNLNQHIDFFKSYATSSPEKRRERF